MERDRHVEERGLSITPLLQGPERGNGTLLKHKRPRQGGPLQTHLSVRLVPNADKLAFNDAKTGPKVNVKAMCHSSRVCLGKLLRPPIRGGDSVKIFGQSSLAIFVFSKWSAPHSLHML